MGKCKRKMQLLKRKRKNIKDLKFSDLAFKPNFKKLDKALKKPESTASTLGLKNGKSKQAGLSQSNDFIKDVPLGTLLSSIHKSLLSMVSIIVWVTKSLSSSGVLTFRINRKNYEIW